MGFEMFWTCPLLTNSRDSQKHIQLDRFNSVDTDVVKYIQTATKYQVLSAYSSNS